MDGKGGFDNWILLVMSFYLPHAHEVDFHISREGFLELGCQRIAFRVQPIGKLNLEREVRYLELTTETTTDLLNVVFVQQPNCVEHARQCSGCITSTGESEHLQKRSSDVIIGRLFGGTDTNPITGFVVLHQEAVAAEYMFYTELAISVRSGGWKGGIY